MTTSVLLEIDSVSKAGLAVQQNGVPLVRGVRIVNAGAEPIGDAKLVLSSDPEFFPPVPAFVSQVLPGETVEIRSFTVCPSHEMLSTMTERTAGALKASLFLADAEAPLVETAKPIDLCAHDEWFGAGFMPELLAAFVTPNADETALLLRRVAELLQERSGSGALDGYQRMDKSRVLLVAKCVYDAVLERAINYAEPPASFGESGQRIRFPRQILGQGFATCLDFTLLMAGMLEQAGLHPILMLQKRHAFLAVHLLDYRFPDAVNDDLQTIRKRVDLDEIAVFEPTAAAGGQSRFSVATAQGARHLLEDDDFLFALDIAQARAFGVRPLADVAGLPPPPETAPKAAVDSDEPLRTFDETTDEGKREAAGDVPARVARWRSKLLDLSRRNRLLNFRETKQSVQIIVPQPDALENALNDGVEFSLNPRPEIFDTASRDPRDAATLERQVGDDPTRKFLEGEFASRRLRTTVDEKELVKRLTFLYRQARSDIEDGGVNLLFLGVGFLHWLDGTGANAAAYRAPLVLVPVRLDRQSARSGYTLARTDEDAVVNETLLEMLRREFGCAIPQLDPPPEDDAGLDVAAVIRIFREAIRDMKGWEIVDGIWLARFHFSKFIMWNDLGKRLDDLCKSPIVNHLIHGSGAFSDGVEAVRPDEVDTCIAPEELFCPASADSSQLAAVIAATRGKNFVLHGPPGTGKSQTIMNLIAFAMAQGKTVLFVAEKRAALEVVQRRLARLGLGPFCLELHSNKSGKADVLAQFAEAVNFAGRREPREWSAVAAELGKTRAALTGYVRALHKTYPCGLTPYRAFSYLFSHEQDEELMREVGSLDAATFEEGEFDAMLEAGRELAGQAQEIPPRLFDALLFARPVEWSPSWEGEVVEAARRLREACDVLAETRPAFNLVVGLDVETPLSMGQLAAGGQFGEALQTLPHLPEGFCDHDWDAFSKDVLALADAGDQANETAARLEGFDLDAVAAFDVEAMRREIAATRERFIITRMVRNKRSRKTLAACLKPGVQRPIKTAQMPGLLDDFERYAEQRRIVERVAPETTARLGGVFQGLATRWSAVRALCAAVEGLQPRLVAIADRDDAETLAPMRRALGAYGAAADRRGAQEFLRIFTEAWTRFAMAAGAFEAALAAGAVESGDAVEQSGARADAVLEHARHLRRWCIWNAARARAIDAGFEVVADAVESGALAAGDVPLAVRKRYAERFIAHVVDNVPEIRNFLGNSHDGLVAKFSVIDDQIEKLAQQVILARLAARLPSGRNGECPAGSELGILKRECAKKSRHKPVRKLLESIPTLLPVLKPCLLMSPLSVAQYLPPGRNDFDIVVFDEASQITVWDAIGAMARGRQVVVVGDPKQLPPTTFFQRQAEEESTDDADIEELESILDECRAADVADLHLLWHYRSRHESLIAFSNRNYYHERLMTFPSALRETTRYGVSFVHVPEGIYDRSKTRTNPIEAQRLVAAVVERLLDPALAKKSTGVVTFSEAQKTLIEDLMDEARREHPEIERFFAADIPEPFFVKNLESVQGDERDAIYFSICYGYDKTGSFAMNFGPLNRPGGERRLNVAVTRAKEQVVVFSSVVSTQIDTGRTQATGALHLRSFLEYAERGNLQQGPGAAASASDALDGGLFEDEVAEYLRSHGYEVDRDVGRSGCRVALAVRSKVDPSKYAIGVDCDGERYAASASARDRDKLRAMVLSGLGWRLVRVWAAAWWFDREATQRKLLADVDAAVNDLPPPSADAHRFEPIAPPPMPEPAPAFQVQKPSEWEKVFEPGEFVGDYAKSQSNFNLQFGPQIIGEQMRRIVNDEGPIVESLLRARVLKEWGFARSSSTRAEILERSAPRTLPRTKQFGDRVFWPEGANPKAYRFYRVPAEGEPPMRKIEEIPVEELRNAMAAILEQFGAVPQDSLYVETARRFGFPRIAPSARKRYDEAYARLGQ
ncbi:MAG: DUF3320 domain-containing protein [Kiritimatiellia bacterium]